MKVFLTILLLLVLLMLVPVGACLLYNEEGFLLKIKIGPFHFRLPSIKAGKSRTPKKEKKTEKLPEKEEKPSPGGGSLSRLLTLIKPVLQLFGGLIQKIRINRLKAKVIYAGAEDPAGAAVLYGRTAAGAGIVEPLLQNTFAKVEKQEIFVTVDFSAQTSTIEGELEFSLRVGQIVWMGIRVLVLLLPVLLKKEESVDGQAPNE